MDAKLSSQRLRPVEGSGRRSTHKRRQHAGWDRDADRISATNLSRFIAKLVNLPSFPAFIFQIDPSNGGDAPITYPSLSQKNYVDMWAVSAEGNVLIRLGVHASRPEGTSWRHVPTDQPFKCVSVGEENCVWGVSQDGAAWIRSNVSPTLPQGEAWIHVGKPGRDGLFQLSVGSTAVWAVDSRHQLWLRKDVSPSTPAGSSWLFVSFNVKHVSCGFLNQVIT